MPSSSFYDICSNQDSIGWENVDLNYYKSSLLWRNKSDGFFPKKWAVGTSCYHMFSHRRCVILEKYSVTYYSVDWNSKDFAM